MPTQAETANPTYASVPTPAGAMVWACFPLTISRQRSDSESFTGSEVWKEKEIKLMFRWCVTYVHCNRSLLPSWSGPGWEPPWTWWPLFWYYKTSHINHNVQVNNNIIIIIIRILFKWRSWYYRVQTTQNIKFFPSVKNRNILVKHHYMHYGREDSILIPLHTQPLLLLVKTYPSLSCSIILHTACLMSCIVYIYHIKKCTS